MIDIITNKLFSKSVEELVQNKKMPYLDAILHLGKEYNMEEETVAKLLTPTLKQKLREEVVKEKLITVKPKKAK